MRSDYIYPKRRPESVAIAINMLIECENITIRDQKKLIEIKHVGMEGITFADIRFIENLLRDHVADATRTTRSSPPGRVVDV